MFSVTLSPNVVMSKTVKYEDLVTKKGLYYRKSSDVPFTGNVTGKKQGEIKKGKKVGLWVSCWSLNGRVNSKETFKDGKLDGLSVYYHDNGKVYIKVTFKDDKEEGPYVSYHDNGQLWSKGTLKDGKREGPWVEYKKDGTVWEKYTGTYKNGVKVK